MDFSGSIPMQTLKLAQALHLQSNGIVARDQI